MHIIISMKTKIKDDIWAGRFVCQGCGEFYLNKLLGGNRREKRISGAGGEYII